LSMASSIFLNITRKCRGNIRQHPSIAAPKISSLNLLL
jgi:hypothetical protein